jgi:hypothetical protein
MNNSDLKNRLRRRTADKLYDRDRTTGRAPTQLPSSPGSAVLGFAVAVEPPPSTFPQLPSTVTLEVELEERIRQRAYEIYVARGYNDGRALEDWLQAEAEILGGALDEQHTP